MKNKGLIFGVIFIFLSFVFGTCYIAFINIFPIKYKENIAVFSENNGLNADFVAGVIFAESRFKKDAISKKGAIGLMQLMPDTAKGFYNKEGFDKNILFDPETNIKIGCEFLKYLFDKYKDETAVLACYNAGEKVVRSWMGEDGVLSEEEIKYKETLNYVKKVKKVKPLYALYF